MGDSSGVTLSGVAPSQRIVLVDCNNFFVSCELVFNPRLIGKPVVVLSNNDGCIVSRSQEAKKLGIPMGEPLFKIASLVKQHDIQVLSSNFSLYADMSARVMQTLTNCSVDIEVYSIDEAFLVLPSTNDVGAQGRQLRQLVKKNTGIPVSLGIASTKTLAKIANHVAKKNPQYQGVCDLTDYPALDMLLESLPVGEVWGVGYRYNALLKSHRIRTVKDLKYAPDAWIQKKMTIRGLKTVHELRGIPCIDLIDQEPARQSITVSRSFGSLVSDKRSLEQAVSWYMIRAAHKLRRQKKLATVVTVWLVTGKHQDQDRRYMVASVECPVATSYTPDLLQAATDCFNRLFKQGYLYKKAGVMVSDLVAPQERQLNLFVPPHEFSKQDHLMKVYDTITKRFGYHTLTYLAGGIDRTWKAKCLKRSPHYTTNWHELVTVS